MTTPAALTATNLTLLDRAKRSKPDGGIDVEIVEFMAQNNAVVKDAVFKEGNMETGHKFTSRRALPSVYYKRYNEGIPASKSRTDQFIESCGRIETWAVTDQALADLGGNGAALRMSENSAFIQAMSNEAEYGFFYNSTASAPEKFMGFAPRMSATTDTAGGQIVLWGGSSSGNDQASAWLVGWGDNTVFGITPKGSPSGLQHKDWGERPWVDSAGTYAAYVSQFHWSLGLCVKDWRYVSRVANIDTSAISATGVDLITAMVLAHHQIFSQTGVRMAWYVNRKIGTYLHLQSLEKGKYQLSPKSAAGEEVTSFLGNPIRISDALTNAEGIIS